MNAIVTRYCGPSNTRSSSIAAEIRSVTITKRIRISYQHDKTASENHKDAAKALIAKHFKLFSSYRLIDAKHGKDYVFICQVLKEKFQ